MHVTVEELPECESLLQGVLETVTQESPDGVVFLGDQHHNHALVRVEVMEFWYRWLAELATRTNVVLLVGNHDRPGDASAKGHALMAYKKIPGVEVVDSVSWSYVALQTAQNVLFAPYYADHAQFVKEVQYMASSSGDGDAIETLVCHATFDGAQYENGFFAPDGLDANLLPVQNIISGHIHSPATFGKVEYLGAPRWRIATDANVDRYLNLIEFENSLPARRKVFPTSKWCTPIESVDVTEATPWVGRWKWDNSVRHVTVTGTAEFVDSQKVLFASQERIRLRTTVTEHRVTVRESEGLQKALERFIGGYSGKYGTSSERLLQMARERINV
jgi:DNA repair exonuclease SbcCD nuclease subunit